MPSRSYDQYCLIARALDVVGERWTLLIVRELLIGPKRYTDLLDGLPGIATNLLSARLKQMEAGDLVRRTKLPPPAASTVYELTELGRGLEPAMAALARWGKNLMRAAPAPGEHLRPGWFLLGLRLTFNPDAARGVHDTYEFRIDGDVFQAIVDDGSIDVRQGHAQEPDLVVTTDPNTFVEIGFGLLSAAEALEQGRTELEGDREASRRCLEIFALPIRSAPPAAAREQPTPRRAPPAPSRTRTRAARRSADPR